MFNSYIQVFGDVPKDHEVSDAFQDMICEMFGEPLGLAIQDGEIEKEPLQEALRQILQEFLECDESPETSYSQADKAYILESAFNYANENFYIYEDDGELNDRHEAQDDFLAALTSALQSF